MMLSDIWLSVCLTSVCLLHTSGLSREQERPRKTKIGTEVAHVTRDSDTTFKIKRSKIKVTGVGHIVAASRTACLVSKDYTYVGIISNAGGILADALAIATSDRESFRKRRLSLE